MNKNIETHSLTHAQWSHLAYDTCQWWNAVFVQAERFFDVFQRHRWTEPWDNQEIFIPERMFFITAINHALEYTERFNMELQKKGDFSLQNVLEMIYSSNSPKDLKNLRNMNEHSLDYLLGEGNCQSQFHSEVKADNVRIRISAHHTFSDGKTRTLRFHNVDIIQLLVTMKEQQPVVREKAKSVFYENIGKTD